MAKNKYSNDMKDKMRLLINQYDNGGFDYKELEWELLNLFNVSKSFYCNDECIDVAMERETIDKCKEQCEKCKQ